MQSICRRSRHGRGWCWCLSSFLNFALQLPTTRFSKLFPLFKEGLREIFSRECVNTIQNPPQASSSLLNPPLKRRKSFWIFSMAISTKNFNKLLVSRPSRIVAMKTVGFFRTARRVKEAPACYLPGQAAHGLWQRRGRTAGAPKPPCGKRHRFTRRFLRDATLDVRRALICGN